jgi:chromosome condensin MukBEF MukE localization factor
MENEDPKNEDYSFLEEDRMKMYFADLNIKLLSGRHLQSDEYNLFTILGDYYDEFKSFYNNLYKLNLVRDTYDNSVYYYLDFFEGSKGKLTDPSRIKTLTEWQTVAGLMLLDMYYSRYFEDPKQIKWQDIKYEIEAGDKKETYQSLFFKSVRTGFTPNEWTEVEKKFRNTVQSFHELGWVNKVSGQNEELLFELKPSIHRIARLYEKELLNFQDFVSHFKTALEQ